MSEEVVVELAGKPFSPVDDNTALHSSPVIVIHWTPVRLRGRAASPLY